jgi:hypothetical protein
MFALCAAIYFGNSPEKLWDNALVQQGGQQECGICPALPGGHVERLENNAMAAEDGKDPCKKEHSACWQMPLRGQESNVLVGGFGSVAEGPRRGGKGVFQRKESMATIVQNTMNAWCSSTLAKVVTCDVVLGHRPFQLCISVEVVAQVLVPWRQPVARLFILPAELVHTILQDGLHVGSSRTKKR